MKKKLTCDLCGKEIIQGVAYKRKYNKYCSSCRKLVKNKKEKFQY